MKEHVDTLTGRAEKSGGGLSSSGGGRPDDPKPSRGGGSPAKAERATMQGRSALLTPRERQVMKLVVEGNTTKQIAARLGASARTIDTHRAHIMIKMQVRGVADLVRICVLYDL